MNNAFIPKLSLTKLDNPFQTQFNGYVQKLQPLDESQGVDFKNVLSNTLNSVNEVASKPDALMHDAMTTGSVDVHDVMIANAKAELTINMTAQVATKVIQAYDRILQIQI
jgi:flagellar hook-basal body complex protein FliE